jgi:hypothetical protein
MVAEPFAVVVMYTGWCNSWIVVQLSYTKGGIEGAPERSTIFYHQKHHMLSEGVTDRFA